MEVLKLILKYILNNIIAFIALLFSIFNIIYNYKNNKSNIQIELKSSKYYHDLEMYGPEGVQFIDIYVPITIKNKSSKANAIIGFSIMLNELTISNDVKKDGLKREYFSKKVGDYSYSSINFGEPFQTYKPIKIEGYQTIEGYIKFTVENESQSISEGLLIVKTTRKNITKKIKFERIENDYWKLYDKK